MESKAHKLTLLLKDSTLILSIIMNKMIKIRDISKFLRFKTLTLNNSFLVHPLVIQKQIEEEMISNLHKVALTIIR